MIFVRSAVMEQHYYPFAVISGYLENASSVSFFFVCLLFFSSIFRLYQLLWELSGSLATKCSMLFTT